MDQPVITSLAPVVLLIASGFVAKKLGWVSENAVKDLSNLVFLLLSPALLFRTMSVVHVEQLSLAPVGAYLLAVGVVFWSTLALNGFNARTAVLALANTFSNTVMIGVPLVGLAYGPEGMVTLLTLVSLHSLVILTTATVVLELAVARDSARAAASLPMAESVGNPGVGAGALRQSPMLATVLQAVRNAVIHPVPIPIMAGLLFAQTGWTLPAVIDRPLLLLGQAFGPMALVMVGISVASTAVGQHLRGAVGLALVKNLLQPALVAAIGWALGLSGMPLTVMIVTASLPIGANVFLFSQRYRVAEALVTASVAVSTALALVTVSVVMTLVA